MQGCGAQKFENDSGGLADLVKRLAESVAPGASAGGGLNLRPRKKQGTTDNKMVRSDFPARQT
jgi:hypothetical protein